MAKLTQKEIKAHSRAIDLVQSGATLNNDQIADVLIGYHEGATHSNASTSAFFTPFELAMSFAIDLPSGGRIIDLCAGIGMLSAAAKIYHEMNPGTLEFTLVELDPQYAAIAQRLLPEARVICGSIFDPAVQEELRDGMYDVAISNPPFGTKNVAGGRSRRYTGHSCEYAIIDIASDIANEGLFLLPQQAVPFQLSGVNYLRRNEGSREYQKFLTETSITLKPGCGVDTDFARYLWRGTNIRTEIASADFIEARSLRKANEFNTSTGQLGLKLAA